MEEKSQGHPAMGRAGSDPRAMGDQHCSGHWDPPLPTVPSQKLTLTPHTLQTIYQQHLGM